MLISFITFATTLSTSNTQFKVPFLSEHSGLLRWSHSCVGTRTWADMIKLKNEEDREVIRRKNALGWIFVDFGREMAHWLRAIVDGALCWRSRYQCWHCAPLKVLTLHSTQIHCNMCVCNTVAPRWKRSLEVNFLPHQRQYLEYSWANKKPQCFLSLQNWDHNHL